jgi:hypothetical protein
LEIFPYLPYWCFGRLLGTAPLLSFVVCSKVSLYGRPTDLIYIKGWHKLAGVTRGFASCTVFGQLFLLGSACGFSRTDLEIFGWLLDFLLGRSPPFLR